MARLFIFGNGYDTKRLNGKTSYLEFRDFLVNTYHVDFLSFKDVQNCFSYGICILESIEGIPKEVIEKNRDDRKKAAAFYLYKMINILDKEGGDAEWNRFENALGRLPLEEIIEQNINENKNEGIKLKSILGSPNSREQDLITSFAKEIHELFADWINTIEVNCDKTFFENEIISKIDSNDIYISFNYTDTVEKMFPKAKPNFVNHLHGKANDNDSAIIVGHRNLNAIFENDEDEEKKDMIDSLIKPVEYVIKKNSDLWEEISKKFGESENNVIYEFGWSCSPEDEEYIKKIVETIPNNKKTTLFLNNFKNEAISKYKIWQKLGYKGNVVFYEEKDDGIIQEAVNVKNSIH